MSSVGLNKWIVSGHLAADAEIKTVELRDGRTARVAEATLYVRKVRNRDESFTISLSIWEKSVAWRTLPYLKKGSLIICTGRVEPNPYISSHGNVPRAGLQMTVLDVDLDNVRNTEAEEEPFDSNLTEPFESSSLTEPFEGPLAEPFETTAPESSTPPAKPSETKPKGRKAKVAAST